MTGLVGSWHRMKVTVLPATPDRWPDVEAIFSARGCSVARGCWCMFYRRSGTGQSLPTGTSRAKANRADLKALVDAGNSVVVVEHDMSVIAKCDWMIDMGPGAGDEGGRIVAEGPPAVVARSKASVTARYLSALLPR